MYGARWSSPGVRVAYAASDPALAVLEVLVHLETTAPLSAYSLVEATVPDELIEDMDPAKLPANWAESPVPPEVQAIGDEWVASGRSLALRVPSAVVTASANVLINPEHADFASFEVHAIEPFALDPRLVR